MSQPEKTFIITDHQRDIIKSALNLIENAISTEDSKTAQIYIIHTIKELEKVQELLDKEECPAK